MPRATAVRTHRRLTMVSVLLASALLVLLGRLWFVQVVAGERYAALAERNRIRQVVVEAPRGRILDRHGRVLVDNRQVHVIGVGPAEMGTRRDRVVADLAAVLERPPAQLHRRIAAGARDAVQRVTVAFDVPEHVALQVWEEASARFPGVHADLVPRRSYPHDHLAAHVLGYVGEISREQLASRRYGGYHPGDQIGLAGVERSYEAVLRGTPGTRRFELDASGRVVRELSERAAAPGADLMLTLDMDVQRLVEDALATGLRRARRLRDPEGRGAGVFAAPAGAAVVLDPRDGAVRAMASLPRYRPDDFVGGISRARYANLTDPERNAPLLNRAIQAAQPPGSVFKVVSTSAALRRGFATPTTVLPCPPTWRWADAGRRFRNWTSVDLGSLTLEDALATSCDTVFYELAARMWRDEQRRGGPDEHLTDEAARYGYGTVLGIDLPGERAGVVPGRAWRRRFWRTHRDTSCAQAGKASDAADRAVLHELCGPTGALWRGGDAVNLAIGQGDLLATPLQVATSFAAIANGGTVWRPRVASAIHRHSAEPVPVTETRLRRVPLDHDMLRVVRRGLLAATAPGGTAADAFAGVEQPVAGKTGTAEARAQPFAWFVGYAPVRAPRHVVVVMIEQGGSGSGSAAPVARWIFDGLARLEAAR